MIFSAIFRKHFFWLFLLVQLLIFSSYLWTMEEKSSPVYWNGVLMDAVNFLIVCAMFLLVQSVKLSRAAYWGLSTGLFLWGGGLAYDLLDELYRQPVWVGVFVEDTLRTLGMSVAAIGLACTFRQFAKMQQKLSHENNTDALTQLYNRRFFSEALQTLNIPHFALLSIDIDHFKAVNDTYGHDVGDKVLVCLAKRFQEVLEDDAVLARVGGEEFALLIHDTDQQAIQVLCDTLLRVTQQIKVIDDLRVTVSIGATLNQIGESTGSVMKRADNALYQAKNNGRNQYVFLSA